METETTETLSSRRSFERLYGILFVLGGTLAFSSKAIWIKLLYQQTANIDAISILALRMAFAIPFYLVIVIFLLARQIRPVSYRQVGSLLLLSFLGYYLASFLDISGLAYIPAGLERMILYLYPTMVVIMVAREHGRPIHRSEIVSLACSYFGIALIFFNGLTTNLPHLVLGSLLVFGAAISFSIYSVKSVNKIHELGTIRFTTWTMLIGASMTLLHFIASHGTDIPRYSGHIYVLAATLALTGTVIPSFMMAEGIRRIGADRTALLGSLGPLATIFLAMEILSEPVSTVQLIGSAIIIAGVLNLLRTDKARK
jgi:drug/metabolite transporter (DMT)-like permease